MTPTINNAFLLKHRSIRRNTDVSEEHIVAIFRVEEQQSKKSEGGDCKLTSAARLQVLASRLACSSTLKMEAMFPRKVDLSHICSKLTAYNVVLNDKFINSLLRTSAVQEEPINNSVIGTAATI
jgi:hypothetical protein